MKLHNLVPGSFYLAGEKQNFHKFQKTSGNATESCGLSACNFTINELHMYFSSILTANFRTPISQNTSQVAGSAESYSGPFQDGAFL